MEVGYVHCVVRWAMLLDSQRGTIFVFPQLRVCLLHIHYTRIRLIQLPRNMSDQAQQGTVKDRVLKCEVSLKAAEETIRQQGEIIKTLREENGRLVGELDTFKVEIQEKVRKHVEKIKEDLQFKHAFIVVQNKQLQNQVIAQKAQKAALVTQIEGLDHRMAALEDAVGTDD